MAKEFLIECAEDMERELSFDKFMDEILITENYKKKESKEVDEEEHRVRNIIKKYNDRPSARTKFRRK